MRTTSKTEKNWAAVRYVASWNVLKRSLLIAAVVGCLLTVANQYDVILHEPFNARLGAQKSS
ncbi:MAG: hypothetical protein HY313_07925 [Acidobacteria bacterium]|nr:hypothetical protein [Acidobacteriota bacterium]